MEGTFFIDFSSWGVLPDRRSWCVSFWEEGLRVFDYPRQRVRLLIFVNGLLQGLRRQLEEFVLATLMIFAPLNSESGIGFLELAVSCDTRLFVFQELFQSVELLVYLVRLAALFLELEILLGASGL